MRVLATLSLSFAAGTLAASLLTRSVSLTLCAVLAVVGAVSFFLRRRWRVARRLMLCALSFAAALCYFTAYQSCVQAPILQKCDRELPFSGTVCDYPVESQYGAKVTIRLHGHRRAKAVYYGDSELLALVPGNVLQGTAKWNDASFIRDTRLTTFTSKGIYTLLYDRDDLTVTEGNTDAVRWWPVRMGRVLYETIQEVWTNDERMAGIMTALLSGDKYDLATEDYAVMQGAGLAHLFAVSGLHCAFLVTMLSLLVPRQRRRLFCLITMVVLVFYMCMVGLSPSVVRACVMQMFLLSAPLFRRSSDTLTALGAALWGILLCNPFAVASVSLRLSFAATFGIALLSHRMYQSLFALSEQRGKLRRRVWSFICANVSVTLGAMVMTTPLVAYYFNTLSLVSPLSSVVALPLAGWGFMAGFVSVLTAAIFLPLAQVLGALTAGLIYPVLAMAYRLTRWNYHAIYFNDPLLYLWLAAVYGGFIVSYYHKSRSKKKYYITTVAAVISLIVLLWNNAHNYRGVGNLNVAALDVGQGESVILFSDGQAALVDCGSSNSYVDAGTYAAQHLASMGFHELEAVVLTHYHADHANGLSDLLSRIDTKVLYLPEVEDEYGLREEIEELARRHGAEVVAVDDSVMHHTVGESVITVYPPLGTGDINEQGLTVLATAEEFDVLITGDMKDSTERDLIERYPMPDVEVLLVGHHGSKYSSHEDFLWTVRPEIAVISVGDNSYGHPTEEAIERLESVGAQVRRTDLEGDIFIYGGEEDGGE